MSNSYAWSWEKDMSERENFVIDCVDYWRYLEIIWNYLIVWIIEINGFEMSKLNISLSDEDN